MNKGYVGTGGLLWGETKACQAHLQCQSRNDNIKRTRARVCLPAVLLEALHGRACLTLRLVFQLQAQWGQQKSKKCDGRAGRGWGRVRRRAERCSRPLIHLSGTTSSSAVPPLARQRFTRAWQTCLRSSVPAPDRWQNQKVTSLWTGSVCCPADFPRATTAHRRGWRRGGEQLWQLLNFVFVNFCNRDFANNTAAPCDFCHGCCCHCWRRLVLGNRGFIYGTESQSVFLGPVGSGFLRITVELGPWDWRHCWIPRLLDTHDPGASSCRPVCPVKLSPKETYWLLRPSPTHPSNYFAHCPHIWIRDRFYWNVTLSPNRTSRVSSGANSRTLWL